MRPSWTTKAWELALKQLEMQGTTVSMLLQEQPTLRQYDIMARADKLLPCGRYYGGSLTAEQINTLIPREKAGRR